MLDTLIDMGKVLVTSALLAGAGLAAKKLRSRSERRHVYRWLCENTRDEPAESHSRTIDIAKGTGLSEDRVRRAVLTDKRIYRARGAEDLWSVWREEPQSVYEKRGLVIV